MTTPNERGLVLAPWSMEQVQALANWQASPQVHPFTCRNRGNGQHPVEGHDHGILRPTPKGWVCPHCDYTQDWAHDFMFTDVLLQNKFHV